MNIEEIRQWQRDGLRWELLIMAIQAGIFTEVEKDPKLEAYLEEGSFTKSEWEWILLTLEGEDLLERQGNQWYNIPLGKKYFCENSKDYLGNQILGQWEFQQKASLKDIFEKRFKGRKKEKHKENQDGKMDQNTGYVKRLEKFFNKEDSIHIIDLGAGDGVLAKEIRETFPNSVMTLVDWDLKEAKERLNDESAIHFLEKDMEEMKWEKEYDIAIASGSLHYVKDLPKFIETVASHLKPKGYLFTQSVLYSKKEKRLNYKLIYILPFILEKRVQALCWEELEKSLIDKGFKILEDEGKGIGIYQKK
ncbi:MAG: class I SAM-dependent methyltransferase [Tissierellia bacterium]|nr:class I SAM-dependent methyltransferase [Tissierellia bacterium]